jgi:hypothetical protein
LFLKLGLFVGYDFHLPAPRSKKRVARFLREYRPDLIY